jgi:hypothetical protein
MEENKSINIKNLVITIKDCPVRRNIIEILTENVY